MPLLRAAAAVVRRPRAADGCLAALVAATALPQHAAYGGDSVAWLSVAAVCAPLVWRRRAPVVVFWTITVLVTASLALTLDPWTGGR